MRKIGFIGAGNMALAISKGIEKEFYLFNRTISKYDNFSKSSKPCNSIEDLVNACDIIFLSIKPQNFPEVLEKVKNCNLNNKIFVSIAAGITIKYITDFLGDVSVIRAMPNTPLLLGEGATALCRNDKTADDEFKFVCDIFSKNGKIAVITEDRMNEVIAISGSSPAYVYMIADIVSKYGDSVGIDKQTSLNLFAQTLIGCGKMLLQSEDTPEILTKKVCSPGGTTIEAVNSFKEDNLEDVFNRAMEKCVKRAYELSK